MTAPSHGIQPSVWASDTKVAVLLWVECRCVEVPWYYSRESKMIAIVTGKIEMQNLYKWSLNLCELFVVAVFFQPEHEFEHWKGLDQIAPQVEPFQKGPATSVVCQPLKYWSKSSADFKDNYVAKSECKTFAGSFGTISSWSHPTRGMPRLCFQICFKYSSCKRVSMSQVQVNRKELQKAGYRVLQEMRVFVKRLWCVARLFSWQQK